MRSRLRQDHVLFVVIVAAKKNETSNSEGIRVHLVFYILYNCGINRKCIV